MKGIDITGQRFGNLIVIKIDNSIENRGNGAYWICRCEREYCKQNNIKLIEIPYWRLEKITIEDLI